MGSLREFDMVRSTSSRRVGGVRRVSRRVDIEFQKTENNVLMCSERLDQAMTVYNIRIYALSIR